MQDLIRQIGPHEYYIRSRGYRYVLYALKLENCNYSVTIEHIEYDGHTIVDRNEIYTTTMYDVLGKSVDSAIELILEQLKSGLDLENPYSLAMKLGGKVRGKNVRVSPANLSLVH